MGFRVSGRVSGLGFPFGRGSLEMGEKEDAAGLHGLRFEDSFRFPVEG